MRDLEDMGVIVRAKSRSLLSEEAPEAYKNVDEVVRLTESAGLARARSKAETPWRDQGLTTSPCTQSSGPLDPRSRCPHMCQPSPHPRSPLSRGYRPRHSRGSGSR